jgi:N-acetylglucosaminyldiphosphoundecaprenol N-acetyl-beta-D-mannosaminyltransferase
VKRPEVKQYNVLGVGVSALDMETALEAVLHALREQEKGYVCVTGVHGVTEARADPSFRKILNRAWLNTPDGMPLVWLGWHHGHRRVDRVYGPDLMLAVCAATANTPYRHFFYGGNTGVADDLSKKLIERFPGLKVAGTCTPPFRPLTKDEADAFKSRIAKLRPDIIWVGLSTPKQERFMSEFLPDLSTTLLFGVGAAFDFHTGRVRQAPRWVQRSGMEWLFRTLCEPRRLGPRYLKNNPVFLLRILAQLSGLKKYPLDS